MKQSNVFQELLNGTSEVIGVLTRTIISVIPIFVAGFMALVTLVVLSATFAEMNDPPKTFTTPERFEFVSESMIKDSDDMSPPDKSELINQ